MVMANINGILTLKRANGSHKMRKRPSSMNRKRGVNPKRVCLLPGIMKWHFLWSVMSIEDPKAPGVNSQLYFMSTHDSALI